MKLIITAEIDDEEIGDTPPSEVTACLQNDLRNFEFWTAGNDDSLGLFGVTVKVDES